MPKIILFNGPPRSGKDTAARMFSNLFIGKQFSFAEELKNATHTIFGLNGIRFDHFEDFKNSKIAAFNGMSPREAYIWVSEEIMKPKFGKDIWGKRLARKIKEYNYSKYAISDLGFDEEALYIVNIFGPENVSIAQIYRPDCDYSNDSRKYVTIEGRGVKHFRIDNNQGLEHLKKEVLDLGEALGL